MSRSVSLRFALPCLGTLLLAPLAHAAGGHHAIDDAELLAPGQCQAESWYERSTSGRLLHLSAGCRVGPVELEVASEPQRQDGTSFAEHGLQVKWATELGAGWSAGLSIGPAWQSHARPRYQGATLNALLSRALSERGALHLNLGRDLLHGAADRGRGGVGADWAPTGGAWRLVAEAYRESGGRFVRAGMRWSPTEDWTVDLSRALHRGGNGESSWTLGVARQFDR